MQQAQVGNWNICVAPRTTLNGVIITEKVHVIGTMSAMYFGPDLPSCSAMLRSEGDMSHITYAGELPENWLGFFKTIVTHMFVNPPG